MWFIYLATLIVLVPFGKIGLGLSIGQVTAADRRDEAVAQKEALTAFLVAPVDLVAFNRKKGGANSGAVKRNVWFYRPAKPGFYYQYMLFETPAGYTEAERFFGARIIVYKFGTTVGNYSDTNEMLIGLRTRLRDPDLGQANLVGVSIDTLGERFGEPFVSAGELVIYHHEGRVLSLHVTGGVVDWFKYFRLSRELEMADTLPEFLLQF